MAQPPREQWHVTWATVGRMPIAPDDDGRRALARNLVARSGKSVLLFAIVDDHVHVWLYGPRPDLVRVVRALGYLFRGVALGPVEDPFIELVRTKSHMESMVPYLLTQTQHHGLAVHPAAWPGIAAADLLGARDIGFGPRLSDVLPRFMRRDVHAAVGLPQVELAPADNAVIAERGVARLVDAAAAAFGAPTGLPGQAGQTITALRVASHLASECGLLQRDLAAAVDRSRTALWRLAAPPPNAVRTVRLRVALDVALEGAPMPLAAPPPEALGAVIVPAARPGRRAPRR